MKWGVRRYQNKDGSLTDKGIKKYATKGYAQDSYNSNKTRAGKIYDTYTGAHKIVGKAKYETSSKKTNKARAEQYLKDKQTPVQDKVKNQLKSNVVSRSEKSKQRTENIHKQTDRIGATRVALKTAYKTNAKVAIKGSAAKILNSAVNAYVGSDKGNYYTKQGAHYVRKAAIAGLSLSASADIIRGFSDVGQAYIYSATKK